MKYSSWPALFFGLVLLSGCASSTRSNTSDKPWDTPMPDDRPGYDAPDKPGSDTDRNLKD